MFLGCTEQRRCVGILGRKVVSEWRKHRDKSVAPICERKDAEPVKDVGSVGDGRKKPVNIVLVDTLREESNDFKKRSGIGAEFLEHGGGEGEFDRGGEASVVLCLRYARLPSFPFPCQSVCVPPVLLCDSGKQGDRKRM